MEKEWECINPFCDLSLSVEVSREENVINNCPCGFSYTASLKDNSVNIRINKLKEMREVTFNKIIERTSLATYLNTVPLSDINLMIEKLFKPYYSKAQEFDKIITYLVSVLEEHDVYLTLSDESIDKIKESLYIRIWEKSHCKLGITDKLYKNNVYTEFKENYKEFLNDIKQRGITRLVHFTKLENLLGVYRIQAIIARIYIDMIIKDNPLLKPFFSVRDNERLDKMPEYISLSLEHPNQYLFKRKQEQEKGIWCILTINPEILYLKSTIFYPYNAASTNKSGGGLLKHFQSLFSESIQGGIFTPILKRDRGKIDCYPTSFQAEILVKGYIPYDKILSINFQNEKDFKKGQKFLQRLTNNKNLGLFSKFRINSEFWSLIDEKSWE